ncbi:MAG: cyclic pyranopterin monophosphate synthase MoaC [Rubricoccaceae bacterium]
MTDLDTPPRSLPDDVVRARMGDSGGHTSAVRTAVAAGMVRVGPEALRQIRAGEIRKGDVLTVAQVAGVLGAKQASRLLPLCHDVLLQNVEIEYEIDDAAGTIVVRAITKTDGPTGVEMEALVAVSVAALTIYDMVKSVARDAEITGVRLLAKTGGQGGDYRRAG